MDTIIHLLLVTSNPGKIKELQDLLGEVYSHTANDNHNNKIIVYSLSDVGLKTLDEPTENGTTLQDNATIKADYYAQKWQESCFAGCMIHDTASDRTAEHRYAVLSDDSGLFIPALDGDPGVHSSRFAKNFGKKRGNKDDYQLAMHYLYDKAGGVVEAYFDCCLCLLMFNHPGQVSQKRPYETHYFAGQLWGAITKPRPSEHGFGYDPFFVPKEGALRDLDNNSLLDHYPHIVGNTLGELGPDIKKHISHRARALRRLRMFLEG